MPFKLGNRVTRVTKEGNIFTVEYGRETLQAYTVLLATGTTYRKLGAKGEQEFSAVEVLLRHL